MVSAASADLCCLILVINEQLVFPQVGVTQVNCDSVSKKKRIKCGAGIGILQECSI